MGADEIVAGLAEVTVVLAACGVFVWLGIALVVIGACRMAARSER